MPMIVTDIAGREPMVILPLADYEAAFEAPAVRSAVVPSFQPEPETVPVPISVKMERPAPARPAEPEIRSMPEMAEVGPEVPMSEGVSLEERFYLEPVEDDGN